MHTVTAPMTQTMSMYIHEIHCCKHKLHLLLNRPVFPPGNRRCTDAQFVKIGADARGSSMGNAFTAMSGGISAMYWNPAGMTSIRKFEAVFLNSDWIAGITYNYTAVGLNLVTLHCVQFGC